MGDFHAAVEIASIAIIAFFTSGSVDVTIAAYDSRAIRVAFGSVTHRSVFIGAMIAFLATALMFMNEAVPAVSKPAIGSSAIYL